MKRDGQNGSPARPTLVWFFKAEDKFMNGLVESTTLADEGIALSLRQFRCVKIDVASIADRDMKATYEKTPAFHFIDPKAESLGKIEGDNAISITRFSSLLKKSWSKMFSMSQGTYVRNLRKCLDGYDRIAAKRAGISRRDEGRSRKLDAEEAKLREIEQKTLEKCSLKKAYLPSE